jgi:hypothetical protein
VGLGLSIADIRGGSVDFCCRPLAHGARRPCKGRLVLDNTMRPLTAFLVFVRSQAVCIWQIATEYKILNEVGPRAFFSGFFYSVSQ